MGEGDMFAFLVVGVVVIIGVFAFLAFGVPWLTQHNPTTTYVVPQTVVAFNGTVLWARPFQSNTGPSIFNPPHMDFTTSAYTAWTATTISGAQTLPPAVVYYGWVLSLDKIHQGC